MRENAIFAGAKVYNKVNNRYYLINEDGATATLLDRVDGEDVLNEDEPKVTINKDNAIAFRFIRDTREPQVPNGYTAVGGVLLKNGNPVTEQGDLVVEGIIGNIPDNVILVTELNGTKAVTSFNTRREKFGTIRNLTDNDDVRVLNVSVDGVLYVAVTGISDTEYETENGTEKAQIFNSLEIYAISADNGKVSFRVARSSTPLILDDVRLVDDALIFGSESRLESITDKDSRTIANVIVPGDYGYLIITPNNFEEPYGYEDNDLDIAVIGKAEDIRYSPVYDSFVFINENMITVVNRDGGTRAQVKSTGKFRDLKGYTLVDITSGNDETRYTFADEGYRVKTLIDKRTSDRGNIVRVE